MAALATLRRNALQNHLSCFRARLALRAAGFLYVLPPLGRHILTNSRTCHFVYVLQILGNEHVLQIFRPQRILELLRSAISTA